MFRYSDNPVADADAYYNELAMLEERVPRCQECGKPIMEDFYYMIHDDRPICAECLEQNHEMELEGDRSLCCDYCGDEIEDSYCKNDDDEVFCMACVRKHFMHRVEIE